MFKGQCWTACYTSKLARLPADGGYVFHVCRHPGAVVASDVRMSREALEAGPFVYCDVQVPCEHSACSMLPASALTLLHEV